MRDAVGRGSSVPLLVQGTDRRSGILCSSEGFGTERSQTCRADVADRLDGPSSALPASRSCSRSRAGSSAERFSFDTVLDVIAPYVRAWNPQDGKFDGAEMHRHLTEAWRKLPRGLADPADDFEDDLEDLRSRHPLPQKSKRKPRFLDYFDLSEMKDPEWLVEGMIPVGSLGSILGESQTYKTFFALAHRPCPIGGCRSIRRARSGRTVADAALLHRWRGS